MTGRSTDPGETPPGPDGGNQTSGPGDDAVGSWEAPAYDRELDVVADLGCSPDGDEPCDGALSAALGDDTLLRFPEGRYRFDGTLSIRDASRVGLVGAGPGRVQLVPPEGFNGRLVDAEGVDRVAVRNLDVDVTASDTTAGIRAITRDGFRIENVTYRGRGAHHRDRVTHAFYLAVRNPDATGVLRNAVARKGSAIGHYKNGNGRGAVWIGSAHRGTAYVQDCEFAEFGNNGLYTSRNGGDVRVLGGTFRNNNVAAVRLSGAGSYVRGARIEVDTSEYGGPRTRLGSSFMTRGIVVEQGPSENPPGVSVEDTTVDVGTSPNPGPALDVWPTGKTVTVVDSTLRAEGATAVVHRRPQRSQGRHSPSTGDRAVTLRRVELEGGSTGDPSVVLQDAPGSRLRACRVTQAARDGDGVALVRSAGTTFDGGTIAAGRFPIVIDADFSSSGGCLLSFERPPELRTDVGDREVTWIPMDPTLSTDVAPPLSREQVTVRNTCLATGRVDRPDDAIGFVGIVGASDGNAALHVAGPRDQ